MFERFKEGLKKGREEGEQERREKEQEKIGRDYLRQVEAEEHPSKIGKVVGRALEHPATKAVGGAMGRVRASAREGALAKAGGALKKGATGYIEHWQDVQQARAKRGDFVRGAYRSVPKVKERRQKRQKRQPEESQPPSYMDLLRGSPEPGRDYGSMVMGNVSPESYLDRLAGNTGMTGTRRRKRGGGGTGGLPYKL